MLETAKKYILAFPKPQEKEVLDLIEKNECFEVIARDKKTTESKEEVEKALQETDYLISSLSFVISYLSPFSKKVPLLERIKNPKIIIKSGALKDFKERNKIVSLVKRVVEIEKELEVLRRQKKESEEKLEELANFGDLGFVPQDTEYTFSLAARIPNNQIENFTQLSLKNGFYVRDLQRSPSRLFLLIIGFKKSKEQALQSLKGCKGDVVPYNFSREPRKEKEIISEELKENKKKIVNLEKELSKLALSLKDLKTCHDFLTIEKTQLEIKERTLENGFLNYILFWAQEKKKEGLKNKLKSISPEITVIEVTPEKGEEPPVILENHKMVKPFEYVTEIFGLPKGDEIDPTPYHALFFILFFGICITDAGYGILLSIFTLLPLLFLKNLFRETKLLKLLFYGGISTFVVGVLFGSYFGVPLGVVEKVPLLNKLKMIDPIEDTVLFMGITFFLGYLQLVFAQMVKIISGRRNKNKKLLLSGVAWGLVYLFVGVLTLSIKVPSLKNVGLLGILISGVGLLLTESMGQRYFLKPLVGGVKILQGLINTMSDILSYSRLMALGLATAVIALIVNQIALLFGGMIPYFGWLVTGLILVGGHMFNLGINSLSGFIHSGRLQFVEFFPKFLEGGGRRFKPTRSNLKYIKVE